MKRSEAGFTLIELMIVVVIISIIAAVAIPSYRGYVEGARASDAKSALLSLANAMERYHTQNTSYVGASIGSAAGDIFPNEAPLDGGDKFYDLVIQSQTGTTFRLEARPKNGQGGGTIALLSNGQRVNWD